MSRVFDELVRVRELTPEFLHPHYERMHDALLLPDMKVAVERIRQAVKQQEPILIYGDYDVDGVTASTLLEQTLRLVGAKVLGIMLPNRFVDGYGMSKRLVERAQTEQAGLVMTVDCGSRNHEIIAELGEAGIDVIVTDHHECGETLPAAVAVVNPKRRDWQADTQIQPQIRQELHNLAGVGVVFKLAQALVEEGMLPAGQEKWLLDLALIGTVCDSMPLTGENRRLCYYGQIVLGKTRRPGLKELMRLAKVQTLDTEAIGFQIGPRLNAAGRMETAEKALDLLRADNKLVAVHCAEELEQLNQARRQAQQEALKEIMAQGLGDEAVLVVVGDWHEGVLGIIAGRLVEELHRPAFVLTEVDGVLKGSGRSFGEFNLAEALAACQEHTLGGGGHAGACGVKIPLDGLAGFRQAMNEYYASLELKDQERFLGVREDLTVRNFEELSLELVEELRQLQPYGEGNPEPVFLLPDVRVVEAARLGAEGNHLRLTVWDQNGKSLKLIRFHAPEEYLRLQGGETVDAWITLNQNEFRGIRSVEGRIIKLS